MIIDHPEILRAVVKETGAHPTHPGAETLVTDLADPLDQYSKSLKELIAKQDEMEQQEKVAGAV
jgi:hypothetical protein